MAEPGGGGSFGLCEGGEGCGVYFEGVGGGGGLLWWWIGNVDVFLAFFGREEVLDADDWWTPMHHLQLPRHPLL